MEKECPTANRTTQNRGCTTHTHTHTLFNQTKRNGRIKFNSSSGLVRIGKHLHLYGHVLVVVVGPNAEKKTMFELFNLNYCVTTAHTKPIVNKVENQENQHAQQSFQLVTMNK